MVDLANLVIIGDFNLKHIDWTLLSPIGKSPNSYEQQIINCSLDNYLSQHCFEPTRVRAGNESSLLDLIFVKDESIIHSLDYEAPLGKSDHVLISLTLSTMLARNKPTTEHFRFNLGDYTGIRSQLQEIDWEIEGKSLQEMWEYLSFLIGTLTEQYVPKSKYASNQRPMWMNTSASDEVKKKKRAFNKYRYVPTRGNLDQYVAQNKIANKATFKAKKSFELKVASQIKKHPKSFWKYVRFKTNSPQTISDLVENGTTHSDDKSKAVCLSPSFEPPTSSSIVTPDLVSSTIDTPTENSSDGSTVPYSESTVPRKDNNWRTLVINANNIANKKAELAAIAEYCDPNLMLISETKLSPDILNGEFVPEGYMGRFRKDRKSGVGGVMIISKERYKIVDADITVQNENESVWAIITLKDLLKLVVCSFYRPPDRGIQPLLDLEIELAQIFEKFRNNPKTTLILGGDFNAGGINWDLCTVDHDATNRPLKEKLISILDEAGLKQMQREPTRGQNLLDLFCCNKPSLIKSINSIPGISDHNIVLADCKLKPSIITKPQRKIYQWSKADWRSIREQTVVFAENFLASASTRNINENYEI